MKNYTVIEDYSRKGLSQQVNHWLSVGWLLVGGIAIATVGSTTIYCQAMCEDSPEVIDKG